MPRLKRAGPYPYRQTRLQRGWEPVDVIGRMKAVATRHAIVLPPGWILARLLFLWENHRLRVPAAYAGLLRHVFIHRPTSRDGAR